MSPTRRRNAFRAVLVAIIAVPTLFLASGCTDECVDKYDCLANAKFGDRLTCVNAKCVKGDPSALVQCDGGGWCCPGDKPAPTDGGTCN